MPDDNTFRKVKYLLPALDLDMDGFPVKQPLPTQRVDQVDPFLLLHHAKVKFNPDLAAIKQGVGPHPHRGFTPVTFVVSGEVHHRDSRGNSQIAKAGEVQWMSAGMGIVHSERPSQTLVDSKSAQEIIQLWINSPAEKKKLPPHYQFLPEKEMAAINSTDGKVKTRVVAGEYNQFKSPVKTESELLILWGHAQENGQQHFTIPQGFNTMIYLIQGKMNINGYGNIDAEHLAVFENTARTIALSFKQASTFLVLSAKPIGEKVERQGPFVMNSQTEILEAMRDYQMGKMGVLIEEN